MAKVEIKGFYELNYIKLGNIFPTCMNFIAVKKNFNLITVQNICCYRTKS